MIGWFPDPYPDELFYSVCARYSERMSYKHKKYLYQELFGKSCYSISSFVYLYLATRLNYLITSLPPGNHYTANKLIDEHTLFPFYSAFFSPYLINIVRDTMKQNSPKIPLKSLNIYTRYNKYLRFCPQCILEDKKQFGECYWHRVHQAPGVEICLMHSIILQKIEVGEYSTKTEFIVAKKTINIQVNNHLELSNNNFKHFLRLAYNIDCILKHPNAIFFGDSIRRVYIKLLYKKYGRLDFKDKSFLNKVLNDFRNYYSTPFLQMFRSDFAKSSNWLIDIFFLDGKINNPLRQLLLIIFLESTVEDFFKISLEYKPFGTDYCPCINRGSKYLQQILIKDKYQYADYSNNTKKVTEFRCICGCISSERTFNRIDEYQLPISENKVKYSSAWEYALKKLWKNKEFSLTEIAQYLGVTEETIECQVAYLKLPLLRSIQTK
ncbi:MAG: TnsD family Tn7-like transposition protein [Nostoc sp.]|uniref:TnsD family Tn7-like transposition protein n=1 Tax=Nostoc sp. TaxID=1180 RepID=UPI002FFB2794